jgi:hypothetical protein
MSCLGTIAAAITNTCSIVPVSGLEVKGWLFNRKNATFTEETNDVLISAIALGSGALAYPITAVKKENNAGYDMVSADNLPDLFTNYFSFQPYQKTAAAIKNFDNMDDVVAVVELKGPKTEGCFIILGYLNGLHKSSATFRALDNNGIPTYEMQSREGEQEEYSRRVFWAATYAATLAILVSSETPTPP